MNRRLSDGPVLHLGGNGHAAVRLERARAALERSGGPDLIDVRYPGFEGRPGAGSIDEFLASVAESCRPPGPRPIGAIASGIGALIALSLRARGELPDVPLIFQGPVLWGLERRWFPVLMRPKFARRWLKRAFTVPAIRDRFVRKHFRTPIDGPTRDRFFDGYADCSAFADFFDWFTPRWLRSLEAAFRGRPKALGGITVWLGGRDRVVGRAEVAATERALGVRWPVVDFPDWGHYPSIDAPEEWAQALRNALEAA
jgi:pimeloyl-ACP methyl ester carboxylesterase